MIKDKKDYGNCTMIPQSNKSIRALNLESNSVSPEMVMDIIKSTINTKALEVIIIVVAFTILTIVLQELRVASQFSGAYLGSATEYAIIDLLPKVNFLSIIIIILVVVIIIVIIIVVIAGAPPGQVGSSNGVPRLAEQMRPRPRQEPRQK